MSTPDNGSEPSLAAATAAVQEGRPDEAVHILNGLLNADADNADALHMLGVLCCAAQRHDKGARLLARSVELKPDGPGAWFNLGHAWRALGRYADAAACYERCVVLKPGHADAWASLGQSQRHLDRYDAAEASLRRAIALNPGHVAAMGRLAEIFEEGNREDEAGEMIREGLAVAPDNALLNLVAARLERRRGELDAAAARLGALTDHERALYSRPIAFEMARIHDLKGEAVAAWQAASDGNAQAARSWPDARQKADMALAQINDQISRFTPELLTQWSPVTVADGREDPVFLIGFPRSGTTLLDQILDARPQLQVMMEKTIANDLQQAVASLPGGYPEALGRLTANQIHGLRGLYFNKVDQYLERDAGARLVDKLPLNTTKTGLLHRLFPQAHFVFAARHPMDIVVSCFLQDFHLNHAMANFLTVETTASYYATVMTLFERFRQHLPLRIHTIRYEDLVNDPPGQTRSLFEFLNIPWDEGAADHTAHARRRGRINTPSYHQVAQPVYRRSVDRWRQYESQLADVRPTLEPFARRLGYDTTSR